MTWNKEREEAKIQPVLWIIYSLHAVGWSVEGAREVHNQLSPRPTSCYKQPNFPFNSNNPHCSALLKRFIQAAVLFLILHSEALNPESAVVVPSSQESPLDQPLLCLRGSKAFGREG